MQSCLYLDFFIKFGYTFFEVFKRYPQSGNSLFGRLVLWIANGVHPDRGS